MQTAVVSVPVAGIFLMALMSLSGVPDYVMVALIVLLVLTVVSISIAPDAVEKLFGVRPQQPEVQPRADCEEPPSRRLSEINHGLRESGKMDIRIPAFLLGLE